MHSMMWLYVICATEEEASIRGLNAAWIGFKAYHAVPLRVVSPEHGLESRRIQSVPCQEQLSLGAFVRTLQGCQS